MNKEFRVLKEKILALDFKERTQILEWIEDCEKQLQEAKG